MNSRMNRHISPPEQRLYDHLLYWVEQETPEQLIDRFHALLIDGSTYPDADIAAALQQVIFSRQATDEFRFVLNRCCHILINRWQARSQSQLAIPELIGLFEAVPSTSPGVCRSRSVRRLRELTDLFRETEQYLTLRRLSQVLTETAENSSGNRPLGTLIRRYPYLYEHCLLSEDSTQEQQHTVRQLQFHRQRQFEIDLSQYVTYQVRCSQLSQSSSRSSRSLRPVPNPTLLSEQELGRALKHYVGKGQGGKTHRDVAQSFLTQCGHSVSYREFKSDLYQYITSSVDAEYGRRQFNNQFYNHLKCTFPESDHQRMDDFLLVRTCDRLFSFLVVDTPQRPNHFVFIDLLTNLGPIFTTGLLLKIVLLCRKVKPSLERRFSILFNHYESDTRDVVQWLVHALENLNVALSSHFGRMDLSLIR